MLGADGTLQDRPVSLIQERLEDQEFVRIDPALDHGFAQAVGAVDQDDVGKTGLGIDREHDARTAEIRADHGLHAGRQRDANLVDAVVLSIADGAIGVQRGEASAHGVEQCGFAAHVQEGLLLTREARLGQVFGRCARSNCHRRR